MHSQFLILHMSRLWARMKSWDRDWIRDSCKAEGARKNGLGMSEMVASGTRGGNIVFEISIKNRSGESSSNSLGLVSTVNSVRTMLFEGYRYNPPSRVSSIPDFPTLPKLPRPKLPLPTPSIFPLHNHSPPPILPPINRRTGKHHRRPNQHPNRQLIPKQPDAQKQAHQLSEVKHDRNAQRRGPASKQSHAANANVLGQAVHQEAKHVDWY